uniref:Septin-type G domain-containing protein n=1 Tax=Steinernema glaseri TaxID=37863 RepID=A0A1I8AGE7_9BILA
MAMEIVKSMSQGVPPSDRQRWTSSQEVSREALETSSNVKGLEVLVDDGNQLYATPQKPRYIKKNGGTPYKSSQAPRPSNDPLESPLPQEAPGSLQDYVGFSNFPNQIFRRSIKEGFEFSLMVVGESGLGKSTFVNTLFLTELQEVPPQERVPVPSTVNIDSRTLLLSENDVRLSLTFVDTPGFGDAVDNSNCWSPIMEFIDARFADFLAEETKVLRQEKIPDRRVHLCLYFVAPTGHGLKQLDVECMRRLSDRVNVLPVIAKADTMTTQELLLFKKRVNEDIAKHGIKVYRFPEGDGAEAKKLRSSFPFAVVGSNVVRRSATTGRICRVREYPWGVVEVENLEHNDFVALRDLIIRMNLIDLIDVTKNVHYENFRFRHMGALPDDDDRDPFTLLEKEQRGWESEFQRSREEKERVFAAQVATREARLDEKAAQLAEMEAEQKELLAEKRSQLESLLREVAELRSETLSLCSKSSSPPHEKAKKKSIFARPRDRRINRFDRRKTNCSAPLRNYHSPRRASPDLRIPPRGPKAALLEGIVRSPRSMLLRARRRLLETLLIASRSSGCFLGRLAILPSVDMPFQIDLELARRILEEYRAPDAGFPALWISDRH